MKLKEYAEKINALAEKYPDVDVIYSADDEGNAFSLVHYDPCVGNVDSLYRGYFVPDSSSEFDDSMTINSVCIN